MCVFLSSLLLPLAISSPYAKDTHTIAVVDFEARGVPVYEAQIVAERVRAELVQSGIFMIMERGQMESILKEQGFQQSGACGDAACGVQIGQLLSVNEIVTGSLGKLGNMYTLNIKLLDVESGQILLTHNEDVSGKIEDIILTKAIPRIVEKLIREISAGKQKTGTLSVTTNPPGAQIKIDSKDYGATPIKNIEFGAGTYRVVLAMPNYVTAEKTVTIEARKSTGLELLLQPTGEFIQLEKQKNAQTGKTVITATRWGFCILGLAGLGVAAYFHYNWVTDKNNYDRTSDQSEALSLRKKIRDDETTRTISAVIGGISAIGFGVTYAF